jgi:threonine aldolase
VIRTIDLRSDTVTRPSERMRRAMADAEVGDDVYGEDPTLARLEARTAELLDYEAALFVPTGSMGNQICARLLAAPGTEVVLESRAHIFNAEMASMAALSGLLPRPIVTSDGILAPEAVEDVLQPDVSYRPRTSLLWIENTENFWGGKVVPRDAVDALQAMARRRGIALHLDGSRIWNAATAEKISPAEAARGFDTVNVCFSKGLGAPVGSAVVGSRETIAEARRIRKLFGGGMRQAGILGAAALVSIDNIARLGEDHRNARALADGLAGLPGVRLDPESVETNIVLFELDPPASAPDLVAALGRRGVLCGAHSRRAIRMVTHLDVSREDVAAAVSAAASALAEGPAADSTR